ncbi:helix-turn-helix transcriptional regulator [Frondihabitans australicus]|nr:AraC family transcriptional regulator [Frondihabitans australicus]
MRSQPEGMRSRIPTLRQFGLAVETFPDYVNPESDLHGLDVVLLSFVFAGSGHHVIGDVEFELTAPSVSVTSTGQKHCLVTDDAGIDVVNLYLDPDSHALPRLAAPLDGALAALIPFGDTIAARRPRLTQVELGDAAQARILLDLLARETAEPRAGTVEALDALCRLLLTVCARAVMEGGLLPEHRDLSPAEATIEEVRAYLDQTFLESHTLASLAERAHLERTYFSRAFSQRVGVPVVEYTTRLRIRHAVSELRSSNRPIAEIAAASGFRDLSHFGRTFRRITGTTPRAYRRDHRGLVEV